MNAFNGMPVRSGVWAITSVLINDQTVLNNEGFQRLEVDENHVAIEPVGLRLDVAQSTSRSAVLESGSEIYFADFSFSAEKFELILKRPQFNESVKICSEFVSGTAMNNRCADSGAQSCQRFDLHEIYS